MPRTTVNIDGPILRELKRLGKEERQPLGRLMSDLLARALSQLRRGKARRPDFEWTSRPMQARVDLLDKEAVRAALEREA
jgi:hypothetical protein